MPPLIACLLGFFMLFSISLESAAGQAGFRITEFMANNESGLRDEDGDLADWIEFANDDSGDGNIGGWFLTDDPDDLTKWHFPSVIIPGGGHLLVYTSGKDRASVLDEELHANFRLSAAGEYLALVQPDGQTIASEYAPSFPPQFENISYGLSTDRLRQGFFPTPTPGDSNGDLSENGVNFAMLNHDRGIFSEPFVLEMTPSIPGSTIRYSTTGSRPSIFNSTTYKEPITISKTTTLRVVSSSGSGPPSVVTTHTFIFLDDVIEQPRMARSITEHSIWGPRMKESLLDLPTMSIVSPHDLTGGVSPEVETSLELIFPDGSPGFQVDCGVEHYGGHTLDNSPKKNMRFSFKSQYGPPRLKYDLFGGNAVTSFDQILLRTGSHDNWFWTHPSGRTGIFIRNRWAFDRSLETGQPAPHGRWVHVYINGLYHGLHHLMERPNDAFMASYFGGDKEDYEALVAGETVDGDGSAWRELTASTRDYSRLRNVIDLDNYADYMLVQFYGGNDWDWNTNQNWSAASHKLPDPDPPYSFFHWDSDVILRSGPTANVINRGGPGNHWNDIKAHEEFRVLLADRAYRYYFNGGMLTRDRVMAQLDDLASRIETAIIAECARWGTPSGYTPQRWRDQVDDVKSTIVAERTEIVIDQMRAAGVFPLSSPPKLNHAGGSVPDGFSLSVSKPSIFAAGTAYFTFDGSDPRLEGGDPSPTAHSTENVTEVTLDRSVRVKARFRSGNGEWSPLLDTFFAVNARPPERGDLLVSEIHFNPDGGDATEFLELLNVSDVNLLMDGLKFTDGIAFTFAKHTVLHVGGRLVLAGDTVAFDQRYRDPASPWFRESIQLAGQYDGSLDNGGEMIELSDAEGVSLFAFHYGDSGKWPARADGSGSSMELIDPVSFWTGDADLNEGLARGSNWQPSSEYHGSPGEGGGGPDNRIVVNEVLTNPAPGGSDVIELYNTTSSIIDISGWFLSNGSGDFEKYRIPDGTTLAPRALLTFEESDFNREDNPHSRVPFSLEPLKGDDVYLVEGDDDGNLLRFVDRVEFGAAAEGESLGRWPDGTGRLQPMKQRTLGELNAIQGNAVRVGPAVISEIHYNPLDEEDEGLEFIEITNTGLTTEVLTNWRLRGEADYDFGDEILDGNQSLVIVGFDPSNDEAALSRFLAIYAEVGIGQLLGPWDAGGTGNKLDNGGGDIRLERPGALQTPPDLAPYFPRLLEDAVCYDDDFPGATDAGGGGVSLNRLDVSVYGDAPTNWLVGAPTPGSFGELPPGLTYSGWAEDFQLGNGPESGPNGDFDSDGVVNLLEFAFQSDPTGESLRHLPTGSVVEVSGEGGPQRYLAITYRARADLTDLEYRVRVSDDLINWEVTGDRVGVPVENGDGSLSITVRDLRPLPDHAKRFIQLMVLN